MSELSNIVRFSFLEDCKRVDVFPGDVSVCFVNTTFENAVVDRNAKSVELTPSIIGYTNEEIALGLNNVCFFNVGSPAPGFTPIALDLID